MASELARRLERQRAKCVDLNAGDDAAPTAAASSAAQLLVADKGGGNGKKCAPPVACNAEGGDELQRVAEQLRRVRAELEAKTVELASLQGEAEVQGARGGMRERERLRSELAKAQSDADEERQKRQAGERELRATQTMLETRTADLEAVRSELATAKRQGSAPAAGAGNVGASASEVEALTRRNAELELELVAVRAELEELTAAGRDPAGPGGTQGEAEPPEGGTGSPGHSPGEREDEAAELAEGTLGLLEETLLQMQARNTDLESQTRRRREVLARAQQELQAVSAEGIGDEAADGIGPGPARA